MQVSDSTSVASTTSTASTKKSALSSIDSEGFLKIMLAELSKQDPLQPNDTKAMIEQLSTLQGIQSNQDLSSNMKSLVSQNELASASSLIGKSISGTDAAGERVEGTVKRVLRTSEGAELELASGERVAMSRFDAVTNAVAHTVEAAQ